MIRIMPHFVLVVLLGFDCYFKPPPRLLAHPITDTKPIANTEGNKYSFGFPYTIPFDGLMRIPLKQGVF